MRFPVLKTSALAQYPATRAARYDTEVIEFIDGSEQRYRKRKKPAKRWIIRLDLLDETEMGELVQFFNTAQGRAGHFEFEDPWTGAVHKDCSLEIDELLTELAGETRVATVLVLRDNTAG